jgi:hypothetical protein
VAVYFGVFNWKVLTGDGANQLERRKKQQNERN